MTGPARDAAIEFYRGWLRIAAAASILGNVAHAILSDQPSWAVAAVVAIGPPVVWLAAVHGLALLVRAQIRGWAYGLAAAGTVVLGVLSAVVSFFALADLVHRWAGYSGFASVVVPLAVDLSMGISTLALMALTRPGPADAEPVPLVVDDEPRLALVAPVEKLPGEKRDQAVTFRVSETELSELETFAAGRNLKPATAARDVVLTAARQLRAA